MKTAEDWMYQFGSTIIEGLETESIELSSPRVSVLTKEDINKIQLDAWKQGMSDAANLCTKREPHGGVSDEDNIRNFGESSSFLRLKILTARNNKTSL